MAVWKSCRRTISERAWSLKQIVSEMQDRRCKCDADVSLLSSRILRRLQVCVGIVGQDESAKIETSSCVEADDIRVLTFVLSKGDVPDKDSHGCLLAAGFVARNTERTEMLKHKLHLACSAEWRLQSWSTQSICSLKLQHVFKRFKRFYPSFGGGQCSDRDIPCLHARRRYLEAASCRFQ